VYNGVAHAVSFYSSTLSEAQRKYDATDKELVGVIKVVNYFRPYLLGNCFCLRTDHQAIKYLFTTKNLSSRLLRWSLQLQEYAFDIEYIKGKNNFSDVLSRLTIKKNLILLNIVPIVFKVLLWIKKI
jgi:hypothetical protein